MKLNRRDLLKAASAAGALNVVWPLSAGLSPAQAREAAETWARSTTRRPSPSESPPVIP